MELGNDMRSTADNQGRTNGTFEQIFNSIFCSEDMRDILKENIGPFDFWYICMTFCVSMSDRYETILNKKSPLIINRSKGAKNYLGNIKEMLYKIKPSMETWIDPSFKQSQCRDLDILFISKDRFLEVYDGKKKFKSDYLFYSIIEELLMNCPSLKIALLCTADAPKDMNIIGYHVYRFIRPFDLIKALFLSTKNILLWKIIKKNSNMMLKGNDSYSNMQYNDINSLFSFRIILELFCNIYAYSNAINIFNPRIIISNDDLMQLKPQSKNPNLQLITLQSATVSPSNNFIRRLFIRKFGSDSVKSDYFICSGEYSKEIKEYSNVSKKCVIMGQPRYDILASADRIYDKSKIIKDLGLNPNLKIVLWCTQTHGLSHDENMSCINAVYNTMSSTKGDAQLVIKLHPAEDQNAPLYQGNSLCDPVILKRDIDTFALLSICDLMITKDSTTAMESIILNIRRSMTLYKK